MSESEVPDNANAECVGPASEQAGQASSCEGCPNQAACASGAGRTADPAIAQVQQRLSDIKHKILILSGKGGVGKSTVSSQLAWTLAESGYSVGVLDVDITGPSIPRMLGVEGEEVRRSNFGWSPVYAADNLAVMSVAFMLASRNDAIIWRGPRKTGLIKQFLTDVDWQQLDFLLVDAPPGTSDEHISLAQYMSEAGIDGAVVVTTPQEVALLDVRKEINFCRKTAIPLLGVVENMSGFVCPCCNHQSEIFPAVTGGADKLCEEMDVPLLGRLPLDPAVLRACERGVCYLRECEKEGKLDGKAAVAMRAMVQSVLQSTAQLRETAKEHVIIGGIDSVKLPTDERKEAPAEVHA